MTIKSIGKIAGSAAVTGALLASGATLVFAQSTYTSGTTSSSITTGSSTSGSGVGVTTMPNTAATGTTGTTPGVPNTGAGGDAAGNLAILGASALVAIGGAAYLARQKYAIR